MGKSLLAFAIALVVVGVAAVSGFQWITEQRNSGKLGGAIVVPAEFTPVIKAAAERCPAVPAEILAAQIAAESSWDPTAVSHAGAQGIAQFMPSTWEQYGLDGDGDGAADVWNPIDAIHSAAALNCVNRKLVKEVPGDRLTNILAAYNAGHGAVRKYNGLPPFPETENYVDKILGAASTLTFAGEPPSVDSTPSAP